MSIADPFPWPLPLIADGGVRSILEPPPGEQGPPVEELNLSRPEQVERLHGRFAAAGAVLHRTNTRWASRPMLRPSGLEERAEAINNSGSALLRAAIGPEGLMMGAIGEIPAEPREGGVGIAERERGYGEQVVYLADTGVTFLLLEHFGSVAEALRVIRIAKRASDAPVLVQFRPDVSGRSTDGLDCERAANGLAEGGADALGIGCGLPPRAWAPVLEAFRGTGLPLAVMLGIRSAGRAEPYAGAPRLTPAAFADVLAPLTGQGVVILGGCCGAGPEHIRTLCERFAGQDMERSK